MNFEVQPILSIVVNILVGCLVSKGIIDSSHSEMIAQEINNVLAALVTLGLGIYSTHKVVDAYKHKVTINAQSNSGISLPSVTSSSAPADYPQYTVTTAQTGLPLTPENK